LPCRQEELFFCDAPSRQRPRQLAGLVDRLSSRLGRQAVLRPALVCEAQPELAYRYEPLLLVRSAGFSPSPRKHGLKPALQTQLPPRPLRLLPQPIAVSVVSVLPDGPPFRFCWQGRDQRIVQSWGPERIETGWWHGRPVGRDYYRVETAGGSRFWLFRRLYDGRWFVHGTFE